MKSLIVRKTLIFYPFLFAIFPILFLYAHNIDEASVGQILLPMVFSIGFTLVLWATLSLILKNVLKGGLATTLFLFFFFFYGRFYELLEIWNVFIPQHEVLLFEILLLWGFFFYCIKISRKDFNNITKILNIVTVVLIIIPVFTIASHQIMQVRSSTNEMYEQENTVTVKPSKLNGLPDIYYIILDEYAHPDTMMRYYNYDSNQIIRNLENRGFFVAQYSRTRYQETFSSISSSLNMEHHTGKTESKKSLYQGIAKNRVAEYLRSIGYQYIYFGNWVDIKRYETGADRYYNFYLTKTKEGGIFNKTLADEFNQILLDTTMLKAAYLLTEEFFKSNYRAGTMGAIKQLKKIPFIKGPKFTFAHIMCPHEPFVFGLTGEHVDYANWHNYKDTKFYREQYLFITHEIEKVVDALLKNSATKPIIIIQSDHGIKPYHLGIEGAQDEWRKIFNAYYLPGEGEKHLYESISPVNSFRVIFNYYFGAQYKLLED